MENSTITRSPEEDEGVDLRGMIKLLLKKIWWILGITAAFTLFGLFMSLTSPKVYQIKTILEIGTAVAQNQLAPAESPEQITSKIDNDFYGHSVRQNLKIGEGGYPKIVAVNFAGNLITLSIKSSAPEQAKTLLKELSKVIINDCESLAAQKKAVALANIDLQKQDIERLKGKVQAVENEKKAIETEISSLNNALTYNQDIGILLSLTSDRREAEAKQQDIENLHMQINQRNEQINNLNGLFSQARPTSISVEPVVSEAPISPNTTFDTMLAATIGFFAAIFLVFGIEWWIRE